MLFLLAACQVSEVVDPPAGTSEPTGTEDSGSGIEDSGSGSEAGPLAFDLDGSAYDVTDLAIGSDGAIWLVGHAVRPWPFGDGTDIDGYAEPAHVLRIAPDGAVDRSFGRGGVLEFDHVDVSDTQVLAADTDAWISRGLDWQPYDPTPRAEVVRLASDGEAAAGFAPLSLDHGDGGEDVIDLAPTADGGFLLLGAGPSQAYVARYLADGTLDPSFGTAGEVLLPGAICLATTACLYGGAVGETPDGGLSAVLGTGGAWRLDATGTVDPTFGAAFVIQRLQVSDVGPDGAIWTVGTEIRRLDPDGTLALEVARPVATSTTAIAADAEGRLVVVGSDGVVFRVDADGALDPTFPIHSRPGTSWTAVEIAPDGTVVAGGWSETAVQTVVATF